MSQAGSVNLPQHANDRRAGDPTPHVRMGTKMVGEGQPCYVIAEIGINHNGDLDLAKRLISIAIAAGCDAVKFQKRTIEVVYSAEELSRPRESPFGNTNGDLKRGLEFEYDDYVELDRYCREVKMPWFASCWDEASVDVINRFDVPCFKIASASLTDDNLLRHTRATGKPILLSTGMSTVPEIDHAVEVLGKENLILLHACSTYPAYYEELNLKAISHPSRALWRSRRLLGPRDRIALDGGGRRLGSLRHRTAHHYRSRPCGASDQAASLEPNGITKLVSYIRLVEKSMGDGVKRVLEREQPILKKLRRVGVSSGN